MKQTRHGLRYHPLYAKYYDMKTRLKRDAAYKDRSMCDEWNDSFVSFYNWSIDNGWKDGLEIDRYPDREGKYEPSNCRYVTKLIQNQNKGKYKSNQEHACIKKQNNLYVVRVQVNGVRNRKSFADIDDAIKYRDNIKGDNYVNSITS